MIPDPDTVASRADLPFLQRRRRAKTEAVAEPSTAAADAVHEFLSGSSVHQSHRPVPAPDASLDLDDVAPIVPRTATSMPQQRPRERPQTRVAAGSRHILSVAEPTVTLTRLQSGIGTLRFEAACGEQVGDLRLGALYELADGFSSTVQLTDGSRTGPSRSRRPVLLAGRDRFERIEIDLRQSRTLRRLVLYAFSASRVALNWGGTLVVETEGGARVELALTGLPPQDAAVLMSLYNIDGQFVLRAEMLTVQGGPRSVAAAFGFGQIAWLDDRTPID